VRNEAGLLLDPNHPPNPNPNIIILCSLNEKAESGRRFDDAEFAMVLFCVNRISHHFRDCELQFGFRFHSFHLSFPRPLKPCFGANSIAVTTCTNPSKTLQSNKCYSSGGGGGAGDIPLLFDSSFRYLSIHP